MKNITILGATGSIGRQALTVCQWYPQQLRPVALTAGHNWRQLADLAKKHLPQMVAVADAACYGELKAELAGLPIEVLAGEEGIAAAASWDGVDIVVAAISGIAGLSPIITAIESGKDIALANKEALVAAGQIVMDKAAAYDVKILPVDSEHSALWQCLRGEDSALVNKLILTASGGAFRDFTAEQLANVTPQMALKHPNWAMGAKITIDSATMVNNGLEIIEAHWLFDMPYEDIDVLIHPESIVHSLVSFVDGSVKAQLALPDMCLPIQYALFYPQRPTCPAAPLDLAKIAQLNFQPVNEVLFPGLKLAKEAGMAGGAAPVVFNAANEQLVGMFLREEISFMEITRVLQAVMEAYPACPAASLAEVVAMDQWARVKAGEIRG